MPSSNAATLRHVSPVAGFQVPYWLSKIRSASGLYSAGQLSEEGFQRQKEAVSRIFSSAVGCGGRISLHSVILEVDPQNRGSLGQPHLRWLT